MKNQRWKTILLGLGLIACIVLFLFAAVRFPVMEVVRNNVRSGVAADAYFYSEVEGFERYEAAVAAKRRAVDPWPGQ